MILVDANVLVYAYDLRAGQKRARTVDLLERVAEAHLGVLSTQV